MRPYVVPRDQASAMAKSMCVRDERLYVDTSAGRLLLALPPGATLTTWRTVMQKQRTTTV